MKVTGQILAILKNIRNGKYEVTFSMEGSDVDELQELSKTERLSFEIKPYRERRSLSQNAYLHVLLDKMAKRQRVSSAYMKNDMLRKYGYIARLDNDEPVTIKTNLDPVVMMEQETLHTRYVKESEGGSIYVVLRGSHELNSAEFSHFLDMVIEEAREMGITTETPEQIAELKARWGISVDEET